MPDSGGYPGGRSCMISGTGSEERQRTREQSSEDPKQQQPIDEAFPQSIMSFRCVASLEV